MALPSLDPAAAIPGRRRSRELELHEATERVLACWEDGLPSLLDPCVSGEAWLCAHADHELGGDATPREQSHQNERARKAAGVTWHESQRELHRAPKPPRFGEQLSLSAAIQLTLALAAQRLNDCLD